MGPVVKGNNYEVKAHQRQPCFNGQMSGKVEELNEVKVIKSVQLMMIRRVKVNKGQQGSEKG